MTLKIGSYEISTQNLYDTLIELKITSDEVLKKFDKNNDKKLDEDELVELADDDETSNNTNSTKKSDGTDKTDDNSDKDDENSKSGSGASGTNSSSSGNTTQTAINALAEMNESLEEQLNTARSRLAKVSDAEELSNIVTSMQDLRSQIRNNQSQIYSLLNQLENPTSVASTGAVSGVNGVSGTNGVTATSATSFGNLDTSSAANFALSLVNGGSTSVDTATMKEMMTSGGYQFDDGAWCGDFCGFVLASVYGKDGTPGNFYNDCWYPGVGCINDWAQEKGVYATDTSEVQPGDLIVYGRNHVGMVVKVNGDGTVDTVEGNTSNEQTGAYDSPTGEGWCSYHAGKSGQYVLLHKLGK